MAAESDPSTPLPPCEVEQSIPACFARVAHQFPQRLALLGSAKQLTYAQLDESASRLAHRLLAHGAPGDRIALLFRHDASLIVAILASLKAARIVVVLNPTDPADRLRQVLADAEPSLLLTDAPHRAAASHLLTLSPCHTLPLLCTDDPFAATPESAPDLPIRPTDLAFLVYTSGSTGRPKGVMQTHRNMIHNMLRNSRGLRIQPDDRIALLASPSGGQGVGTLWCALLRGAALCPFPLMEQGVTGLADWMVEQRITIYVSAASLFRHFIQTLDPAQRFPAIRTVRLASEPATSDDLAAFCRHFAPDCLLLHTFSSSEAGNITQSPLPFDASVESGRLPLGCPVDGMELLLLDATGQNVPPGQTGQIVIRSRFLSPGYWRNPDLTAARFSEDVNGFRLFRTGDLGSRATDGQLLFAGRRDAQVKIHGYRVELSEIESALEQLPAVARAAVHFRAQNDAGQLVACIVPRPAATPSAEDLRTLLRPQFPSHMIPGVFIFLERFPLTPHGKIDHAALRALKSPPPESAPLAPTTPSEALLAELWAAVLRRTSISRAANFFDLGGDSLAATVIAARLHAARKIQLELRAFTDHPVLADLALHVDQVAAQRPSGDDLPPLEPLPRDRPAPISFGQESFWQYSRKRSLDAHYNMATALRIRGPLDVAALRAAMSYIVGRHEILRTTFQSIDGQAAQIVHPPAPIELPVFDLSTDPDPEAAAIRLFRREALRPFRLDTLPLLRFILVRTRLAEHLLLRISHHIVSDAGSWLVYFRELAPLYEAALRGDPPPLPPTRSLQYIDYAAWQRRTLGPASPHCTREIDWWAKRLAGLQPPAELPFARRWRNYLARPADGFLWWGLEPGLSQRLDQLARAHNATAYMVRMAAFAALLAAECRQPTVILGTFLTNRRRIETLDLFGVIANFATLPLTPDPSQSFSAWLATVRRDIANLQSHAQVPHALLGAELRRRGITPPEVRAIFRVADHTAPQHFGGLELAWTDRRIETMPWRFTLTFDPFSEQNRCHAAFDARRYQPVAVRAFLDRLQRLLDAISHAPESKLADLLAPSA